jgi:hypothetical protein
MSRPERTVWRVTAGSLTRLYFTEYHAEQMARALRGNGMTVDVDMISVPDDAVTGMTITYNWGAAVLAACPR